MAWAPIDQKMRDGTEMIKLRRATGLPAATLLGHLTLLWLWALDNALDGVLPADGWIIAAAMQWDGEPDKLLADLLASGFVLALDSERVEIAEFRDRMEMYALKLADLRNQNAARQRRHRAEQARLAALAAQQEGGAAPDVTLQSRDDNVTRNAGVTQQNRDTLLYNGHITLDQSTEDQSTEDDRSREQAQRAREESSSDGKTRWISDDAKLLAFAEYKPDEDDKAWAKRTVPTIDYVTEVENLNEWCHLNREKILRDYDSPRHFWRRWMRRALEKQTEQQKGKSTNGTRGYAAERLQAGAVGQVEGDGYDSRQRARGRARAAER